MKKRLILIILILFFISNAVFAYLKISTKNSSELVESVAKNVAEEIVNITDKADSPLHPLSIKYMQNQQYPGSELAFEQTLTAGTNYSRYIVSYMSEGYKIFGLLTIPTTLMPQNGYPVIIFNHGYIPPAQYRTTERYVAYQDAFAKNGYITLKSDYRGHGSSEGDAEGGYGSPAYTIDILNAVSSIKNLKNQNNEDIVDEENIGMWGHSMGGNITLRSMVVTKDIKAGVIWAGVVASYPDLINNWRRGTSNTGSPTPPRRSGWRQDLITLYGEPANGSEFWDSISPNSYLNEISGPVQIHHGTNDTSVPVEFSESLNQQLIDANKEVGLFIYEGDDHNISQNLYTALNRSVAFFDKYLKSL